MPNKFSFNRMAICLVVCLATMTISSATASAESAPNIVIIFMDDMGYADIGPFGGDKTLTPNLNRMADEGRRFTDFYVSQAVCSASRTSLLTGCYNVRVGIQGALGPASKEGIHADEVTLGELCQQKNYATACFGKWHLGSREQFLPLQNGFHEYFGLPYSNDMWPFHPEVMHLPLDAYYFYWGHNLHAVRSGQWKLHLPHDYRTLNGRPGGTGGIPTKYEAAKIDLSLYDLTSDPGESNNVADQQPEVVARLQAHAKSIQAELGEGQQRGTGQRAVGKL